MEVGVRLELCKPQAVQQGQREKGGRLRDEVGGQLREDLEEGFSEKKFRKNFPSKKFPEKDLPEKNFLKKIFPKLTGKNS